MKRFPFSITALLVLTGLFYLPHSARASDGAILFNKKLPCFTCHGPDGRGMVRTKDRIRFFLKKKAMYRKMVKEGIPVEVVRKLIPLYKKRFWSREKFLKAIEELIGPENTEKYKDIIIKIAIRVYYQKGDPIPGFEGYPRLAGNKKIYLFRQMKDILEGKRTNGNSEAMRGIKSILDKNNVTDSDLEDIAEYLSRVR